MTPLLELDPRWCATGPDRLGMGLSFNCPCGLCARRITIWFWNPVDGGPAVLAQPGVLMFYRDGISFEHLSALPAREAPSGAHWWGCIENGMVS